MTHVLIEGIVQGVGFRQFVRYKARKLGVVGWVKNLPDGRVEALFEGDAKNVEKMVEISKRGPYLARVKKITMDEIQPSIRHIAFDIIKE